MIVGFNHNVLYLGVGFHVQTEDGGLKSPSLVTLLYHGGTIVSSQKTSYADILGVDNLNQVVEDLAKEQHKGMLRRLTKGEFDQRIHMFGIKIEGGQQPAQVVVEAVTEEVTAAEDSVPVSAEAAEEESWLGEEIDALEPVPIQLSAAAAVDRPEREVEEIPAADSEQVTASDPDDLPVAIEPAYDPLSAEDRDPRLDVSDALDDLIFSYLTGGNGKG